ncbi:MAG: hypothetical protein CME28_01790 [Gemmatimonadetes bacterium]|nr:hypothetical protein [Gemmatimonadota bacterium]|tara:strand:+ start:494 stop:730 length:237 start_codon:yes stop_codon:yes gene_type:complete
MQFIENIMRFGTGIMLGAFAVIIMTTTFSTADWVASLGKVMYWVILSIALLSLCMWIMVRALRMWGVRSRLSGKSEKE